MTIYIGSARIGSNGKATGDKAGDQKQTFKPDYKGEVSMQTLASFVCGRKLYIIRAKKASHAKALAVCMKTACNNYHLGYDQNGRLGVITYGVSTMINTECDCGTLVRECVKEACGVDPGNFDTSNEVDCLEATGLFEKAIVYNAKTKVYEGDIFATQTKGHTGVCTDGYLRAEDGLIRNGIDYSYVLDTKYYADSNPDLKAAFGYDEKALLNHFITFGCNEKSRWGKTISDFNVWVYANHSPDLPPVFGDIDPKTGKGAKAYYEHYCIFGHNENRRVI